MNRLKTEDAIAYIIICFILVTLMLAFGVDVNSGLWFTVYLPLAALLRWKWDILKIKINNWSTNDNTIKR